MPTVIRYLFDHKSETLMCIFVALIVAGPLGDSHPHIGGLIALVILITILAGATYMTDQRIARAVVLPAAGLWAIARLLEAFGDPSQVYTHLAPIAGLALSCTVLWAILGRFGTVSRVTSGVIAEAFISYLILAIAFSQLYWILLHLVDHPFNQAILPSQTSTLMYFSMITISSVGYGGIVPVDPYVRIIAALESMTGIFYIAVVVARLVSAYRPRHRVSSELDLFVYEGERTDVT